MKRFLWTTIAVLLVTFAAVIINANGQTPTPTVAVAATPASEVRLPAAYSQQIADGQRELKRLQTEAQSVQLAISNAILASAVDLRIDRTTLDSYEVVATESGFVFRRRVQLSNEPQKKDKP